MLYHFSIEPFFCHAGRAILYLCPCFSLFLFVSLCFSLFLFVSLCFSLFLFVSTCHITCTFICALCYDGVVETSTVGTRFATVRITTIHFYDPCPVRPSTPDLWCITVATPASFLYLVRFQLFSAVHVFLLFLF
jgi:hypothetical protein